MGRRGAYAKGLARRREILRMALEVIARSGYSSASVRELAEAVGLSQAGLLHHFGTKEELFIEVLRTRDEVDAGRSAEDEGGPGGLSADRFVEIIEHNAQVPGLVHLYTRLQAEAADASHAAHEYFRERQGRVRAELSRAVRAEQDAGRMRVDLDPEVTARTLMALADGLQAQWLYDPQVDMAGMIVRHLEALRP
ncbi:TetR/AcrR family transcriptional regulator [Nesterenkonia sp. HG001]|uniref:TetR/AcrR family transcriptional regulator n=1 Tax=Nesterenkonia sp. HG001 TaxID=2983207 RepID=UPI002AC63F31|nr:TetR/AcrR family transcriptional regulator [Nesterenkonia sp. HG001]MDZ5076526.1 TetR/AcrR family transcriptional regulator [Nesterenkonia sp. HG001]